MSVESKQPFSIGPDKPLKMRVATFVAIIVAFVSGALFAQDISRRITDLAVTVTTLVDEQHKMTEEQRSLGRKVDRLEWVQSGRRGPEPEKP